MPAPEVLPPALVAPEPLPVPEPLPEPAPAPPAPAPPAPRRAAPPSRSVARGGFPEPIMRSWSLGPVHPPASTLESRTPAERDAAASALRALGSSNPNFDVRGAENLGPDWMNEFSQWVHEHLRYPDEAARNLEDGTNVVTIRVTRDGHVSYNGVELDQPSGSQWLDLGTQSLFRNRNLPPFPPDAKDDALNIQVTIHYIIVRR